MSENKEQITIGQVFAVEAASKQISNLTAGKLGYCLARNLIKTKSIIEPARKQCISEIPEVQAYLTSANLNKENLSEEHLKEVERIESLEKELLAMPADIDWYRIKIKDVPGMKEDDPPEKGVLPMAIFTLLLDVGIIDDTEDSEV
jgi:hypothetical protein